MAVTITAFFDSMRNESPGHCHPLRLAKLSQILTACGNYRDIPGENSGLKKSLKGIDL